jgi:thiol-disulfide isomerase/thioredoxin
MTHAPRIALALCLAVACGTDAQPPPGSDARPDAGAAIEIVGFDGLEAALAARPGQGLLLNFWATWCAPCVAELPDLVAVSRAWRDRGGRVVGVSYDLMVPGSDRETIVPTLRRFLAERHLDLDVLVYDEDDYDAVNERFSLPGEIPVTLAIDKTGRIVDRQEGQAGRKRFEEMMRRALGR